MSYSSQSCSCKKLRGTSFLILPSPTQTNNNKTNRKRRVKKTGFFSPVYNILFLSSVQVRPTMCFCVCLLLAVLNWLLQSSVSVFVISVTLLFIVVLLVCFAFVIWFVVLVHLVVYSCCFFKDKLLLSIYSQLCVVKYGECGCWSLVWVEVS